MLNQKQKEVETSWILKIYKIKIFFQLFEYDVYI